MLPLLVGKASSRRGQTRRCHEFEHDHLDDKQVSTTQNVGDSLNFFALPRRPADQACEPLWNSQGQNIPNTVFRNHFVQVLAVFSLGLRTTAPSAPCVATLLEALLDRLPHLQLL